MITLACDGHGFRYEMEHIARMFVPGAKILAGDAPDGGDRIVTEVRQAGGRLALRVLVQIAHPACSGEARDELAADTPPQEVERRLGVLLYGLLCGAENASPPPWGILTGVRPVRLCHEWERQGLDADAVRARLTGDYLVQPHKAALAIETAQAQRPLLGNPDPKAFSLYVGIPFCPTRCLYCSFVSHAIDRAAKLIPDYLRALGLELCETARVAARCGLRLETVYIGGGTPTSLTGEQLTGVLSAVADNFDLSSLREYTVEAGRPDTITDEKLEILRNFGVSRISINPQTMDDTILKAIGRAHTAALAEERCRTARAYGFDAINMDLIAGLPGESGESFASTLDRVLALAPESITLHTLTVKRSSHLRERADAFAGSPLALDGLLQTARRRFGEAGYAPYYLYRQKGAVQNLENTGFSLPGKQGLYNIYSMEESHTILAAGAGGITKLCGGLRVRRVCNHKYPYEYIRRFDELLGRKSSVEAFYENNP